VLRRFFSPGRDSLKGESMKSTGRTSLSLTLALAFSSALAAAPAYAQGVTFSARSGTGMLYGLAKEIVYYRGFTESELDWAIQPVFFAEMELELKAFGGLLATLSFRNGFPGQSGFITDSDWLNYAFNGDTSKTNFSQHNCFTERAILVDARVGWEFALADGLALEPFGAFGLMSFQWTARDGYLQYPAGWFSGIPPSQPYPAWSPSDPKVPVYGMGIDYWQTYLFPAAGIRATLQFARIWTISVSVSGSPYLWCFDIDNHDFRGLSFTENMTGGWLIEPEIAVELRFSERATVSLEANYRHIEGLFGDSTQTVMGADYPGAPSPVPGTTITFPDTAGVSYDSLSISLNFSLTL
jgi:outer membrane protease